MQLEDMRAADLTAKALVFSQFNSTIDWWKVKLEEHGFGFRTISGDMTLSKRTKVRTMHLCPVALTCALQTCLMASLFCLSVLPSSWPFLPSQLSLGVHHTTMQNQLPHLAGPLRCLWSPQDTHLT